MADVTYNRVNWEDSPSTDTPINATNLNKMDAGISQVVTRANESMPYANILDDWTDIGAVTTPNVYTADAMRVAELNTNLNGSLKDIDIRYNATTLQSEWSVRGADTWNPFTSSGLIPYLIYGTPTWDNGESSIVATSAYSTYKVECLRGAYSGTVGEWMANGATVPQSITITFKTPKVASRIELVNGHDSTGAISNAVLYGSNDGTTWAILIPTIAMPQANLANKEFAITQNKSAYKYYKLTITAHHGAGSTIIGALQLY